jgi:hypothetical protein
VPAPLEMFLRAATSGHGTITPELWQHFGGDQIVEQLKKYDPNVSVIEEDIGGGEAGSSGKGFRINVDMTKLPRSKKGTPGLDLRASNFLPDERVLPGSEAYHDEVYGDVRNSKEFSKAKPSWWEIAAPIAVSMVAPMAGAALAAGGIGGAAGMTAAATGSGLTGINSMNLPQWLIQAMAKAPQTAGQISKGNFDPLGMLLSAGGSALGVDPNLMRGGSTLAQLAMRGRKP